MLKELFTAAFGMLNQQTRLEVTANNMANASTAGYRREAVFERNLIDARANFYNVKGDAEQNDPPIGSYTNFNFGAFQQSNNPLDLAMQNDGFFVTIDEEGKQYLTRSGQFRLSTDGTVIAMDGKMLMGEDGPINIRQEALSSSAIKDDSKATDIRISLAGEVFVNNLNVGTIQVATVENPQSLMRISGADFVTSESTNLNYVPMEEVQIKQGWLESSNVDIIKEMVEMIELQRGFEAGSKVIQTNDTTIDNSIRLGRYY